MSFLSIRYNTFFQTISYRRVCWREGRVGRSIVLFYQKQSFSSNSNPVDNLVINWHASWYLSFICHYVCVFFLLLLPLHLPLFFILPSLWPCHCCFIAAPAAVPSRDVLKLWTTNHSTPCSFSSFYSFSHSSSSYSIYSRHCSSLCFYTPRCSDLFFRLFFIS